MGRYASSAETSSTCIHHSTSGNTTTRAMLVFLASHTVTLMHVSKGMRDICISQRCRHSMFERALKPYVLATPEQLVCCKQYRDVQSCSARLVNRPCTGAVLPEGSAALSEAAAACCGTAWRC